MLGSGYAADGPSEVPFAGDSDGPRFTPKPRNTHLGMAGELFRPIFVPDEFREAVSGRAWLRAMLDAEGALALAQARVGLIPRQAAETIVSCCDADRFDPEEIGPKGRAQGNPVPPLVRALTEVVSEVSEDAARYVHKGATSQDIMDTAAMLVCRHALGLILTE